jgi:hypothetical protein
MSEHRDTIVTSFTHEELTIIHSLKNEGEKAFLGLGVILKFFSYHDTTQLEEIFLRHVVVTGGMFASLIQGEKVKDIDIYFLDYDGFLDELEKKGYRYFKEMILAAGKTYEQGKGHLYSLDKKIVDVFTIVDSKYQIMTTDHLKREDLVSNFDYKHCTISWHNGKLYLTEKAYRAAKRKLLIPNRKEAVTEYREQKFLGRGYKKTTDIPEEIEPFTAPVPWSLPGVAHTGGGGGGGSGVVHVPVHSPVITGSSSNITTNANANAGGANVLTDQYLNDLKKFIEDQVRQTKMNAGYSSYHQQAVNVHEQKMIRDLIEQQRIALLAKKQEDDDYFNSFIQDWSR